MSSDDHETKRNVMVNRVFSGDIRNVYVAGDLHGDHQSFEAILKIYEKNRNDSVLIFLGDYADRGMYGVEIITELSGLLNRRDDIVALKGNHEQYVDGKPSFSPCNLIHEAGEKYGSWENFYKEIMLVFLEKLYIAAIVNKVLFIHGGISSKIKAVEDLSKRKNDKYLLWSDPSPVRGEHPNPRGAGVLFGEDITSKVLSSLGLEMIVRSHEPGKAAYGPYAEHGGKIITVNSCSSYGAIWDPFALKMDTETLKYEPLFLGQIALSD
jgi:predicted phosphodiesterase